jgi:hypothetical protein
MNQGGPVGFYSLVVSSSAHRGDAGDEMTTSKKKGNGMEWWLCGLMPGFNFAPSSTRACDLASSRTLEYPS